MTTMVGKARDAKRAQHNSPWQLNRQPWATEAVRTIHQPWAAYSVAIIKLKLAPLATPRVVGDA